jgi:hypothetical protein
MASRSTIAPAVNLARVAAVISAKRFQPPRMCGRWGRLRIVALGFGFSRRQLAADGGGVGSGGAPARSATSRQCPALSFVTSPREASPRRRSPAREREAPAALASTFTLAPGLPCRASRSFRSAVRVLDA